MESKIDDNAIENYFFSLALEKEIIIHSIKETYEIIIKENDEIEDCLEKTQVIDDFWPLYSKDPLSLSNFKLTPRISQYFCWKYDSLEWISLEDKIYIAKLLFWEDFPWIDMLDTYIEFDVIKKIDIYRDLSLKKKGLVFYLIFSIIENVLNIKDEESSEFLMNEAKESVETELLYMIEKALKLFEKNARKILLSFRSVLESIHSDDFLTDDELISFQNKILEMAKAIIEDFKDDNSISASIKRFHDIRNNYKNMIDKNNFKI